MRAALTLALLALASSLLVACAPTRAFETRSFRQRRRVTITVGDTPPRDAFSTVHGVSLSYRDELGDAQDFDAPMQAHAAKPTKPTSTHVFGSKYSSRFRGRNVTLFVLDSGCDGDVAGTSFVPDDDTTTDVAGHGTSVMSVARAVAPDVAVSCVKIFDRKLVGTVGRAMQALAWSAANCVSPKRCVVVLAGGGNSALLSQYARNVTAQNTRLVLVASAGNNEGGDCDDPAKASEVAPGVVSVGALGATATALAPYSAAGRCVSILAPGWVQMSNQPLVVGTSYAAAAAAGIAAQLWEENDSLQCGALRAEMVRGGTKTRAVLTTPARRNTTTVAVAATPYAFPTTSDRRETVCGSGYEWRWWFDTTELPVLLTFNRNASAGYHVTFRDALTLVSVNGTVHASTGEAFADADDDRRAVLVDVGGVVRVGTPRAFVASLQLSKPLPRRVELSFGLGAYSNITLQTRWGGSSNATTRPVLPPCGRRDTARECVKLPVSPADSSCVWMGSGVKCVRADTCDFKTRNVCERRGAPCAWVRVNGGSCVKRGTT